MVTNSPFGSSPSAAVLHLCNASAINGRELPTHVGKEQPWPCHKTSGGAGKYLTEGREVLSWICSNCYETFTLLQQGADTPSHGTGTWISSRNKPWQPFSTEDTPTSPRPQIRLLTSHSRTRETISRKPQSRLQGT